MERMRVAGRFVRQEAEGAEGETKRVRAPRPKFCRTFTRNRLAEGFAGDYGAVCGGGEEGQHSACKGVDEAGWAGGQRHAQAGEAARKELCWTVAGGVDGACEVRTGSKTEGGKSKNEMRGSLHSASLRSR